MKNNALVRDYVTRCTHRLKAVDALFEEKSWADVVRESQEIVELALKALLRASQIEIPRIHDVSQILTEQKALLPQAIQSDVSRLAQISKSLRRDRELAFTGSEDLTPSEFYNEADGTEARESARFVVRTVRDALKDSYSLS